MWAQAHLSIFPTPREILCFSKQGLGWEAIGDQWSGMASCTSQKCCTVTGKLLWEASLSVLGDWGELKKHRNLIFSKI